MSGKEAERRVPRCILGIFAHPDDEAFSMAGTFQQYHRQGVHTALICATRGQAGEISDPALATPANLGQVREQELRDACALMCVDDLTLLEYHDGQLDQAEPHEVIGALVAQIRRLRPQVVVTFDANGGYGHRDHIAIHHFTVAACQQAADPGCFPEQLTDGLAVYRVQRLLAVGFSRRLMASMRAEAEARGEVYAPGGNAATILPEEMGTDDDLLVFATVLDDQQFAHKIAAMRAHRTQLGTFAPVQELAGTERVRAWLGTERFAPLNTMVQPGTALELDLFASLREE